MRSHATLGAFLFTAAAFEYFAVPRLLMLDLPLRPLSTFSSCSILIGLVGGWLRVPFAWLLTALLVTTYFGSVAGYAATTRSPENIWLLGLEWTPFLAPFAVPGLIAGLVVAKVAERRR